MLWVLHRDTHAVLIDDHRYIKAWINLRTQKMWLPYASSLVTVSRQEIRGLMGTNPDPRSDQIFQYAYRAGNPYSSGGLQCFADSGASAHVIMSPTNYYLYHHAMAYATRTVNGRRSWILQNLDPASGHLTCTITSTLQAEYMAAVSNYMQRYGRPNSVIISDCVTAFHHVPHLMTSARFRMPMRVRTTYIDDVMEWSPTTAGESDSEESEEESD